MVVGARDRTWVTARSRAFVSTPDMTQRVAEIVAGVRLRGDAALVEWARKVDDARFDLAKLRVPIPMHDQARALVAPEIARALSDAKERMTRVYERERDRVWSDADGSTLTLGVRPYASLAVYVPGGERARPSALLAGVIPARLAGVSRTIVVTPPRADGTVPPAILYACSLCEVDELYAIGGAHAVAAAAFGTVSLAPVEKIIGGRSPWVLEAKRQVEGTCNVDMPGPSPAALIVVDDTASSEFIAVDVLALAERGPDATVVVVSESRAVLESIAQLLETLGETRLTRACFLVHAGSREEIFAVLDGVAPDRVALHVRDAEAFRDRIGNARAIFIGESSSIVAGEFILPCSYAMAEFTRPFVCVAVSPERTALDAQTLAALAELEGLPFHAQSARLRGDLA